MEDQFERYQCQIALPGFGVPSQKLLNKAKVLLVGMGGLGCPTAQYLAAAGIGTIGIADDDTVSLSNLHRQILYAPQDLGLYKVDVATQKLKQQNPTIDLIPYRMRVSTSNVMELIAEFDLIIEGTDNFDTKYLLNDACVIAGKPLIYGAIHQYEGQVSIWNVLQNDGTYSSNYRDVFPEVEPSQIPNCSEGGVIPPLAGIVGCMQANEAIKYLTGSADMLVNKLWTINVVSGRTQTIKLRKTTHATITSLPQTIPLMTLEQLKQTVPNLEIIDVRSAEEHKKFNIGGKNIPLNQLHDLLPVLVKSPLPIVIYCLSGQRSMEAAKKIKEAFPTKEIYSLKGGISQIHH